MPVLTPLIVTACTAQMGGAELAGDAAVPSPVLPMLADGSAYVGPYGQTVRLPGPYPMHPVGAVVDLRPREGFSAGAEVQLLAASPSGVTVNWANRGDFDLNLSPADPLAPENDPEHPMWGVYRTTAGTSAVQVGAPTFAWAPHAARGVLLVSTAQHPTDGFPAFEAHPAGVMNPSRSGPAFSMLDGGWRPGPGRLATGDRRDVRGNLWVDVTVLGDAGDTFGTVGTVWLPFADGWTGGYVSGLSGLVTDLPTTAELGNAQPLDTKGPFSEIDFGRQSGSATLSWLEDALSNEVYTEFEGEFSVKGGMYTITGIGDDAFEILLERDGAWERVLGLPGLHSMLKQDATIELEPGRHKLRVRHLQAEFSWGLRVLIEGEEFAARAAIPFEEPGATCRAWRLLREPGTMLELMSHDATGARYASGWLPDEVAHAYGESFIDRSSTAARLVLPGFDPERAFLFVQSYVNNGSVLLAQAADRDGWIVQKSDVQFTERKADSPPQRRGFSFVAIPAEDDRVHAARVDGATGEITLSTRPMISERTGVGSYSVRLPDGTGAASVAVVQIVADEPEEFQSRFLRTATWEQLEDGSISVQTHAFVANGLTRPIDSVFEILVLDGLRASSSIGPIVRRPIETGKETE